ncbi:MAG TPA: PKD domain-containing protein [Vicinamibacterales bacterium]
MNRHAIRLALIAVLAFGSTGCDDNDPITNPGGNQAPLITISANVTFGIAQLTTFALGATVLDPNADPVTVTWSFSDGTVVNGNNVWRQFPEPGSYEVFATATDHLGLTGTSTTATLVVGTASGEWDGEIDLAPCGGGTKPIAASLSQSGGLLTGTVRLPEGLCSSSGGTATIGTGDPGQMFASGAMRLHIVVPGAIDARLAGQMGADTNTFTGTLEDADAAGIAFTLNRQ